MRTTLGGLSCQVFPEQVPGKPSAAVVLCHGFGAPGDDLVGLHGELLRLDPSLASMRFVFPEAPLSLASLGYGAGRAWWMIDFEQVQRLQVDAAALAEFRRVEPEGMQKARAMLLKLVDELLAQTGLPRSKLALGGFSQGAMITTDVALRLEEAPMALAIMSGTLLIEDVWKAKAKSRAGLAVLQSHGTEDPILPFEAARRLEALLIEAGLKVDFLAFRGGHGIPSNVLTKLSALLHDTSQGHLAKMPT